jgi:hypothetical protein
VEQDCIDEHCQVPNLNRVLVNSGRGEHIIIFPENHNSMVLVASTAMEFIPQWLAHPTQSCGWSMAVN